MLACTLLQWWVWTTHWGWYAHFHSCLFEWFIYVQNIIWTKVTLFLVLSCSWAFQCVGNELVSSLWKSKIPLHMQKLMWDGTKKKLQYESFMLLLILWIVVSLRWEFCQQFGCELFDHDEPFLGHILACHCASQTNFNLDTIVAVADASLILIVYVVLFSSFFDHCQIKYQLIRRKVL